MQLSRRLKVIPIAGVQVVEEKRHEAFSMSSHSTVCMVAREPMPAIQGLKSILSGAEVSLITDASSLMTVADPPNPRRTTSDLTYRGRALLWMVDGSYTIATGQLGHPEQSSVNMRASEATHRRMGCAAVGR